MNGRTRNELSTAVTTYSLIVRAKTRSHAITLRQWVGLATHSVNVSFLDLWRKVKCGVMWNALHCNVAERGLITVRH